MTLISREELHALSTGLDMAEMVPWHMEVPHGKPLQSSLFVRNYLMAYGRDYAWRMWRLWGFLCEKVGVQGSSWQAFQRLVYVLKRLNLVLVDGTGPALRHEGAAAGCDRSYLVINQKSITVGNERVGYVGVPAIFHAAWLNPNGHLWGPLQQEMKAIRQEGTGGTAQEDRLMFDYKAMLVSTYREWQALSRDRRPSQVQQQVIDKLKALMAAQATALDERASRPCGLGAPAMAGTTPGPGPGTGTSRPRPTYHTIFPIEEDLSVTGWTRLGGQDNFRLAQVAAILGVSVADLQAMAGQDVGQALEARRQAAAQELDQVRQEIADVMAEISATAADDPEGQILEEDLRDLQARAYSLDLITQARTRVVPVDVPPQGLQALQRAGLEPVTITETRRKPRLYRVWTPGAGETAGTWSLYRSYPAADRARAELVVAALDAEGVLARVVKTPAGWDVQEFHPSRDIPADIQQAIDRAEAVEEETTAQKVGKRAKPPAKSTAAPKGGPGRPRKLMFRAEEDVPAALWGIQGSPYAWQLIMRTPKLGNVASYLGHPSLVQFKAHLDDEGTPNVKGSGIVALENPADLTEIVRTWAAGNLPVAITEMRQKEEGTTWYFVRSAPQFSRIQELLAAATPGAASYRNMYDTIRPSLVGQEPQDL